MKDYKNFKVSILGSTGSVGTQSVCVAEELGVKIGILAAGRNVKLIAEQAEKLCPEVLSVADAQSAAELKTLTGNKYEIIYGADSLASAVENTNSDAVVHSIAGLEGTRCAIAAAKSGTRLAMANKEAIISAGGIINAELEKSGGTMIPVDSEHSAIFQCLRQGGEKADVNSVKRILLTASGGPFVGKTYAEMSDYTPAEALAHPTWKMGPKITVDSASLMNKGFEVMEAVRLFSVEAEKVKVLIHRQSIIHSMVEYIDNSVIAQLAAPDMRSCIRYALSFPERAEVEYGQLDFAKIATLTFADPDFEAFPLLGVAYEAIKADGTLPASLIAADEVAVDAFLTGRISFGKIYPIVAKTLEKITPSEICAVEDVYEAVRLAKNTAENILSSIL